LYSTVVDHSAGFGGVFAVELQEARPVFFEMHRDFHVVRAAREDGEQPGEAGEHEPALIEQIWFCGIDHGPSRPALWSRAEAFF
jgi:hypothetical protein